LFLKKVSDDLKDHLVKLEGEFRDDVTYRGRSYMRHMGIPVRFY